MYSGYLDRITETNEAIILIDSLQQQFHVPVSSLPPESMAGTWLLVDVQEDEIITIHIDTEKTHLMTQEVDERMQRLKSKKTSRFKRQ